MPIKFMNFIQRIIVQANPDWCFVFGDNEVRKGYGGQAKEMRGEPNSIGVRTKRIPSWEESAYWSEQDKDRCIRLVDEDMVIIDLKLADGRVVVFPTAGLGTGLSQLPKRAPSVHVYIQQRTTTLAKKYGVIK